MNNVGIMEIGLYIMEDGLEWMVSVNYVGFYFLMCFLFFLMGEGICIVNMVFCIYVIGKLDFLDFFFWGRKGSFWCIFIYSNIKFVLLFFIIELVECFWVCGIIVNVVDLGIVFINIIWMD